MTKKFTLLLLLISNILTAQIKPQPTQFDKFIKKQKIVWAAYASDTFNFDQAGLNNLLLNRLTKNEIKASLPVESRTAAINNIKYLVKDSIDKIYFPEQDGVVKKIDTSVFVMTEITQILYVENGTLKSYVPFVTPTLPVYMSTGKYLGESFYFNTAYNHKYRYTPRKRNKLLYLGQTKKMITINPADQSNKLKEMYGQNVLEALWPSVLENKIALFSMDSNKKLNPEETDISSANKQPILVPIYNSASTATVLEYRVVNDPVNPGQFSDAQLIQDWYYDHTKNIVFAKNKEMVLYLTKWDKEGVKDKAPVLKLVFK